VSARRSISAASSSRCAGVDLVHVPFRGATAVLPDLVAGRIDMFIGAVNSLLPLIREGSLRALAATSLVRIASLPGPGHAILPATCW
jgi:tripartite-type tricarboxylate transporter receptor subunit TctC